jgi:hypothetical protein
MGVKVVVTYASSIFDLLSDEPRVFIACEPPVSEHGLELESIEKVVFFHYYLGR